MSDSSSRLRFLWEEETAPPEEAPRRDRDEPAGIPRPLRRATRFALIAVVATGLMAQIIGIRLVASVDAAPNYTWRLIQLRGCKSLRGQARVDCIRRAVLKLPAMSTVQSVRGRARSAYFGRVLLPLLDPRERE